MPHGDIDKDMAYAVHINFDAPLGDDAVVAALFGDDTDEGILDKSDGREKRTPTQIDGSAQPMPAKVGQGKTMTGESALTELQERLAKASCGTEGGNQVAPTPSLQKTTEPD